MKRTLFSFLLVLLPVSCWAQTAGQPVPIKNPDFEAPIPLTHDSNFCGMQNYDGTIPGWVVKGGGVIHWTCDDGVPPSNVAFLAYGGPSTMMQDLGFAPNVEGTYVLKFFVASWLYFYWADYTAALYIGPYRVCTTSGFAEGDMREVTLVCHIPRGFVNAGFGNLSVHFANNVPCNPPTQGGTVPPNCDPCNGWPLLLDNVSLWFFPTT